LRCYEKAVEHLGSCGGWERCVILQQLGAACIQQGRFEESQRWLDDCAAECARAKGHPKDAVLLNGCISTQQTRMEFCATIEQLRAQSRYKLGDEEQAMWHIAEAKRMEAATTGDAVQRIDTEQASRSAGISATAKTDEVRELWAATPKEQRRVKQYHFSDEGPTVLLVLDLNEHLGIGAEASAHVQSLQQFRVECESHTVNVQLRLRHRDRNILGFSLRLHPLVHEIVPEDTVPKLRGKDSKRRLEVKLFKRDKNQEWYGDLVKSSAPTLRSKTATSDSQGTLLNPLTAEELAKLPTPSGNGGENRPSFWSGSSPDWLQQPDRPRPAPMATLATFDVSASEAQRQESRVEVPTENLLNCMD